MSEDQKSVRPNDELERLIAEIACSTDFAESKRITDQFSEELGKLMPLAREVWFERFRDAARKRCRK